MAYIGKEPQTGSYSMLDNLTASATASYSLTLDSVAFVPESANHLIVSLNGVIQKAGSSFTVSGSTLTFSSTLASSDSIDFVLALGNVLDIGTPSDATVTNAKTNFVSTSSAAGLQIKGDGTTDGTLQLNCSQNSHGIKLKSPAHSTSSSYTLTFPGTDPSADKFLKTDGSGNLSFADVSSGIDHINSWYVDSTTSLSANADTVLSNWSQKYNYKGSVMTESSGVFTFPESGIYRVVCSLAVYNGAGNFVRYVKTDIEQSTNSGSSFSSKGFTQNFIGQDGSGNRWHQTHTELDVDIENATTHRLRIIANPVDDACDVENGANTSYIHFMKIADT